MDAWEVLNGVYEPLYQKVKKLRTRLLKEGYPVTWDWYAFHSSRRGGEPKLEYFPIPVLTVEGVCNIGLALDRVFAEGTLTRQQASSFDWTSVSRPFELYGVEDCLEQLYGPGMSLEDLPQRIASSGESAFGLQFVLPSDCGTEELLAVVADCKRWGTNIS